MSELPGGTITFLFTDIEGSTRLWEQRPEEMKLAHARHSELVLGCVARHVGTVVRPRGEGDSVFAVFLDANQALAATACMQRALHAETWPSGVAIRVRAAIHTGTATLRDGDYNSSAVNRCARLRGLASGGQTLLSQAAYDLVQDDLPEEIELRDMGLHRLKDLQRPEHIYQLILPDLPADFPPLRSLDALPTNLPQQLTSFVGRQREMAQIRELLATTRLLTLVGTGGAGKTRLALQVAADNLDDYRDGVWLAPLAALQDESLVATAVAAALNVREEPNRSLVETLTASLRPRSLLLVLDNCEHLVTACASLVGALLAACPKLRVLATSQENLGVAGEVAWRVPSLPLPEADSRPGLTATLLQNESVRLFVERAVVALPAFALNARNARDVAQICRRLDGIPLALELAAARVRVLSPEQIALRLHDRFRLLTGSDRTALPRHQTLRATVDWSYNLLTERERLLMRRLACFAGGWTLEAAEAICSDSELPEATESHATQAPQIENWEVVDILTQLADKSLVMMEENAAGERRYHLLETVRQYGRDRLRETGEDAVMFRRHAEWFLAFAENSESRLRGPEQVQRLQQLEAELDNLRAALENFLAVQIAGMNPLLGDDGMNSFAVEPSAECPSGTRNPPQVSSVSRRDNRRAAPYSEGIHSVAMGEGIHSVAMGDGVHSVEPLALRLAGSLWRFWFVRGHFTEGRRQLERALEQGRDAPAPVRAQALTGLGTMAWCQGDYAEAEARITEALALWRELQQQEGEAYALNSLGLIHALAGGEAARVTELYAASIQVARAANDRWNLANSLHNLGVQHAMQDDLAQATLHYQESLDLCRELGDLRGIAYALGNMAEALCYQGDLSRAATLYAESLERGRELGDLRFVVFQLANYGDVARALGDRECAAALYEEGLRRTAGLERENALPRAQCLEGLGLLASGAADHARAARFWGAAERLREARDFPRWPLAQGDYETALAVARLELGESAFAILWQESEMG